MSNGEPLTVDSWAKSRLNDIQIFVQDTHHARRMDASSYVLRDAETWDEKFAEWLIAKGRVRAPYSAPYRTNDEDEAGETADETQEVPEHFQLNDSIIPVEPPPVLQRLAKKAKAAR